MKNLKTFLSAILIFIFAVGISSNISAQDDKKNRPSPPATTSKEIGGTKVTVDYSSPAVKGRRIWGELVPYDQVWRTGANEPTKITFSDDVVVEGKELKAGTYALFTIPQENEWTVIFNSNYQQWGAYDYSEAEDVLRVKAKPKKSNKMAERMKIDINEKGNNKGELVIAWENLEVPVTIEAKKGNKAATKSR